MAAGIKGMPVRGEGDGNLSRGGRIETVGRFALGKADQCSSGGGKGKKGTAGQLFGGVDFKFASAGKRPATEMRRSRKYSYVTSTVSKFMLTGISEPRRFRSLPVVNEVHAPFRKINKKYIHVHSTIQEFMVTGLSKPRRLPKLPLPDNPSVGKFSASNSRKFSHISSSVSKFMKTGIAEPRRYRSVPVVVEADHKPVINKKKQFAHVTSAVGKYVKTGVLPEKRKTASLSIKESIPKNNHKFGSKLLKQQSGQQRLEAKTGAGRGMVSEQPKFPENRETESVNEIIANLVRELRNVNAEAQPTETGAEMTMGLNTNKFPNVSELLNSNGPFDLVLALGFGFEEHFKFFADFEGIGPNSKTE